MLIPESEGVELSLVLLLKYLLEDVFEVAIILLEDGILGTKHDGHLTVDGECEGLVSEVDNGFIGIVHT